MGNIESSDRSGSKPLNILIVDSNRDRLSLLKRAVNDYGDKVVAVLADASELIVAVGEHSVDVVVVGIDLPDSATLDQIAVLNAENPRPVVMFAEQDTPQIINKAVKAGVNAYVVDDLQPQRLKSIITIASARFREHHALLNELEVTKNKLEQRKVVDRAKGMLMTRQGLSEQDAFAAIRKMAMDKGQTLAVAAENIISVLELVDIPQQT